MVSSNGIRYLDNVNYCKHKEGNLVQKIVWKEGVLELIDVTGKCKVIFILKQELQKQVTA